MDNPAAPIPPISPQPAIFSPVESQGQHWIPWAAGTLAVLTLGIGLGIFSTRFLDQSQKQVQSQNQEELDNVKEELNLCVQNKGKVIKSYIVDYPVQDLGVSSSLFEGRQLNLRKWSYKGNIIKEYFIEIPNSDTNANPIEIKIWDFFNVAAPHRSIFDTGGNASLIPNFDDAQTKYVTPNKISWTRSYGELFSRKDTTSIHTIFVQILGDQRIGLLNEDWQNYVNSSTKELEPIADTIIF